MPNRARTLVTVAAVLGVGALVAFGVGQNVASRWCQGTTAKGTPLVTQIRGCTFLIETGGTSDVPRASAYNNRGVAHVEAKDYIAAAADYDASLKLRPDDARTLANRGFLAITMGKPDEAAKYFDRAVAADPKVPDAYVGRGSLLAARRV